MRFKVHAVTVGKAWAGNSINTVVFRRNSLCTYKNTQYIAFYNKDGYVVLGKRHINKNKWTLVTTAYKGKVTDAHNTISIITDAHGYLHMAWDHHNNRLHYVMSKEPGSLGMAAEMPMTGLQEKNVTYPEFYKAPGGDIFFMYRDGQSGKGNLVLNRYSTQEKKWIQVHKNLIDGEGKRNAYWQAYIDNHGTIHISWVWRESPDVASNHDLCYARSTDGGITWKKSTGEQYQLPITESTAEKACSIPQRSELINQTSMCATQNGLPVIATYWRDSSDAAPQYHVVYNTGNRWLTSRLHTHKEPFTLSGTGTKRIPISRPQVVAWQSNNTISSILLFRDEELGSAVTCAYTNNIEKGEWHIKQLLQDNLGSWEPTYDTELWKARNRLDLFVQKTEQVDGEGKSSIEPTPVKVLAVKMKWK